VKKKLVLRVSAGSTEQKAELAADVIIETSCFDGYSVQMPNVSV
jgi:hypothetical protein